jgi:hypothetical protein
MGAWEGLGKKPGSKGRRYVDLEGTFFPSMWRVALLVPGQPALGEKAGLEGEVVLKIGPCRMHFCIL